MSKLCKDITYIHRNKFPWFENVDVSKRKRDTKFFLPRRENHGQKLVQFSQNRQPTSILIIEKKQSNITLDSATMKYSTALISAVFVVSFSKCNHLHYLIYVLLKVHLFLIVLKLALHVCTCLFVNDLLY